MMPLALAQKIVHEWTGETFELHDPKPDVQVFCSANKSHDGSHVQYAHSQRGMSLEPSVRPAIFPPVSLQSLPVDLHLLLHQISS